MYDELVKRLHRYSENCVAYKLDADFADAVQQAADTIEELSKPRWIAVTERLPEEEGYYLTIGPYGAFRVCYYGSSLKHRGYKVFLDQNKKKINAIAWMIIPCYEKKEEE